MKIAHFSMFAPHQTGLYETTYDMIKAERMAGHVAEMVDIGIDGKRKVGAVDERRGIVLKTVDYDDVRDFDLFVVNVNITDGFLSETNAPVVQIMHGRPLCSFRLHQTQPKKFPVYDVYLKAAHNTRYKALISLWPENLPYWRMVVPEDKLFSTTHPPCDLDTFQPAGTKYDFGTGDGVYDILIADMWREDHDPFEVAAGLCHLATWRTDFRVHFYSVKTPLGPWQRIFNRLKELGVLGETKGVMFNITDVYRSSDLVVTYHTNATRILREAMACGTPVVAPDGNSYGRGLFNSRRAESVAAAVGEALDDLAADSHKCHCRARADAEAFSLKTFGPEIIDIYQKACGGHLPGPEPEPDPAAEIEVAEVDPSDTPGVLKLVGQYGIQIQNGHYEAAGKIREQLMIQHSVALTETADGGVSWKRV